MDVDELLDDVTLDENGERDVFILRLAILTLQISIDSPPTAAFSKSRYIMLFINSKFGCKKTVNYYFFTCILVRKNKLKHKYVLILGFKISMKFYVFC